ncbi:hypothetical protein DSCW_20610 [Desulfosarcina widdelii]|uniref:Uncharacterized protein n=2 Tax=Desulfosarcina widdelii TaxID=947919 RepID=A0A5K7Z840_9BACT|nr:hypothetical protein DSCW_20610 [Desulfosarcina widdelii]
MRGTVIVKPEVEFEKQLLSQEETMIAPRVATPYDQNPARIALVLKDRRKQARKKNPTIYRVMISFGLMALYAAHYFVG